jgi:hypothetical protein
MRPSSTIVKAGLSVTAAVLLLTACGGSDEEPVTTSSAGASATSSAAAESSGPPDGEVQAFCTEAEAVFTRVGNAFDSVTDPANFTAVLDQGVAAFDQVEPPPEISSDWAALQEGLRGLRDAVASTDPSTPEGQAALRAAVTTFQNETAEPQQNLEQFVTANCDNAATGAPSS